MILLAAQQRAPDFEYTPSGEILGDGLRKGGKPQVMEMTRRLLRLNEIPRPDDAADALAITICHAQTCATPLKRRLAGL